MMSPAIKKMIEELRKRRTIKTHSAGIKVAQLQAALQPHFTERVRIISTRGEYRIMLVGKKPRETGQQKQAVPVPPPKPYTDADFHRPENRMLMTDVMGTMRRMKINGPMPLHRYVIVAMEKMIEGMPAGSQRQTAQRMLEELRKPADKQDTETKRFFKGIQRTVYPHIEITSAEDLEVPRAIRGYSFFARDTDAALMKRREARGETLTPAEIAETEAGIKARDLDSLKHEEMAKHFADQFNYAEEWNREIDEANNRLIDKGRSLKELEPYEKTKWARR